MDIFEKIYPPKISRRADWENFGNPYKDLFYKLLPLAKPICFLAASGIGGLILQVFFVGLLDRFGISPKITVLVSSLLYAVLFAGLAIVGVLKNKSVLVVTAANADTQPICKILLIRREKREVRI